jgi:hypothetical protein
MILLFNHIPVTIEGKINEMVRRVKAAYGSEYYNVQGYYWKGDNLTIDSLFPSWILKEYNNNSSNVNIVPIIKNYLRWLFSIEYGYGAQLEWTQIRTSLLMNDVFLEALADYYFPDCDFSGSLNPILQNLRKFGIKADSHYFNRKGTPEAIRWVLTALFDLDYDTTKVDTIAPGIIQITGNIPDAYKSFFEYYVIPAGNTVVYKSV